MKKQMFIALLLGVPLLVFAQAGKKPASQTAPPAHKPAQPVVARVDFPVTVLWKLNNYNGSCDLSAFLKDVGGKTVSRGHCTPRNNSLQFYDVPEGDYELVPRASCHFGNSEGVGYAEEKKVTPDQVRISVRKGQVPDVQLTVTD